MKQVAAVCAIFLCLFFSSCAVAQISCDCGERACVCFIQLGDSGIAVEGIRDLLVMKGYMERSRGNTYDSNMYQAVCSFQREMDLEENGLLDDYTLTLLVQGDQALQQMDENERIVWVPTDGSKKCHKNPKCSGMYDPRKMSDRNAELLNIDPCKRCNSK